MSRRKNPFREQLQDMISQQERDLQLEIARRKAGIEMLRNTLARFDDSAARKRNAAKPRPPEPSA